MRRDVGVIATHGGTSAHVHTNASQPTLRSSSLYGAIVRSAINYAISSFVALLS